MDLRRRLAQLDALTPRARPERPDPAGARGGGAAPAGAKAAAPVDTAAAWERLAARLALAPVPTPAGPAWAREEPPLAAAPPPPRSLAALADLLEAPTGGPGAAAAGAAAERAAPDVRGLLLLDTETTGLAGGTGSLAFLVGCAWWEGGRLRRRQYFLPAPGREAPLLLALAGLAQGFTTVVTYNGQGFDLPLLRTRALLARLPDPLAHLAGWDLLRAARRLWRRRLPDCRQATVEAEVCGRPRAADDLPGALIPPVYFRWLREGAAPQMPAVFRHNGRDLAGMAAILARAGEAAVAVAAPPAAGAPPWPWQDAWSAGRLCERRGRPPAAAAWIEAALRDGEPHEALYADAVRILKRAGAWERAAAVAEEALRRCGSRPWLHRTAAILYEHRLRRPEAALAHARRLDEPARLARLARKLREGTA